MKEIERLDKQSKELSKKIDDRETNKERKERDDTSIQPITKETLDKIEKGIKKAFELSPTQIKNLQNKGITTQDGKPLFPKEK